MILFRLLRALITLVLAAVEAVLRLACSVIGCILPLAVVAVIVLLGYRALRG